MLGEADATGARLGLVQSIVRAFAVLDVLAGASDGLTLSEVAAKSHLPRSTAHRLLTTMQAISYVEFEEPSARWMIGVQAFVVGNAFLQSRDLGRIARPRLRSLMLETGEAVNFGVADGASVRCVERARPHRQRLAEEGERMPFHSTASGKVVFAHSEPAVIERVLRSASFARRTPATTVEKSAILRKLERIRTRGCSFDDQENAAGRRCIAVPIFDGPRRVVGSLSITGAAPRFQLERTPAFLPVLQKTAADIMKDMATYGHATTLPMAEQSTSPRGLGDL